MSYAFGRFGSLGDWWDDLTGGGGDAAPPPQGPVEEAIPQTGADSACTAEGGAYNPVSGQCVMGGPTPQQLCTNVGMLWKNGMCVDPLAGKTKPGTGPLEPGGPGTPGWGQGGGGGVVSGGGGGGAAAPLQKASISPWLIGGVVGLGALLVVGLVSKKKTETAAANRRRRVHQSRSGFEWI